MALGRALRRSGRNLEGPHRKSQVPPRGRDSSGDEQGRTPFKGGSGVCREEGLGRGGVIMDLPPNSPPSSSPPGLGMCIPYPSAAGTLQCASGGWHSQPVRSLLPAWVGPGVWDPPHPVTKPIHLTWDPGRNRSSQAQRFCPLCPGGSLVPHLHPRPSLPVSHPAQGRSGVDGA